ncbi:MAG TPA: serine hydrolase [Candidatus Angelobacter sp.]|nr:serine hydrolase [Candidatus Angelobacter sp.]
MRRAFAVSFALAVSWLCATAQESTSVPDRIAGIWASEQLFGPRVGGTLAIDARGSEWHARIAGFDVPVQRNGNEVRFLLPSAQGEFRGHVSTDAKAIVGHWIQPASSIFSQRYATPVDLREIAKSAWQGQVVPLPERISFYFSIHKTGDGITAVVRNPEFGWFNGRYQVQVNDKAIVLSNGGGQLQGTYDAATDALSFLLLNGSAAPVVLTRRNNTNATALVPRVGHQHETYAYAPPLPESDGWETGSLTDAGLDPKPVTTLLQSILDADPDDPKAVAIHSILIARHGKLVLEEYFYGFDAARTHDMRSAGKTLGTILIGVARDHGAKVEPSTPLSAVFARYKPFSNWDDRKARITVENAMTMTPGLACDDNDNNSPGQENTFQSQTQQPDWYKYALDLPMARDPGGTAAIYCSASLNLTGGVAQEASGRWNADLFYDFIARPLQFATYHLNLMPTGQVYTGGGAYIRPRDQLKLGQVYLSKGMWNGRRIVSAAWVEQSTATHSGFARPVVETDLNHQYGYGWHIHHFSVNGHEYREYAAEGAGGQMVMVLPELDLVVAVSAGDYRSGNWYRWMLEILPKYIIPAATTAR